MSDSADTMREPIPGYRLTKRLGQGGFGEVWEAEAPGGLRKAIKLVHGKVGPKNSTNVERELKGLSRMKEVRHPFILSMERFEVVQGQLVIVMELADSDLVVRFEECRKEGLTGIPRDELLRCMIETAEALDFIHGKYDIQHLDIKPANLLVVAGHVKVADFGLAKDLEGFTAEITGGATPVYAAPETFDGRVSRNSDQYSLAIVYQELRTGLRPFPGPSARQLMLQHLTKDPDVSVLPIVEQQIIRRALSKDPLDRFLNCLEFVQELQKLDELSEVQDILSRPLPTRPSQRRSRTSENSTAAMAETASPEETAQPISRDSHARSGSVPAPPSSRLDAPASSLPQPPPSLSRVRSTASRPRSLSRSSIRQQTSASTAVASKTIIGIDLGTTNSVAAVMEGNDVRVITNQEGAETTPSVVAFTATGERLIGEPAKRQATVNPRQTVFSAKRLMGCRFEEVEKETGMFPFEIVGEHGKAAKISTGEQTLTPPEVSAMVLQKLKAAAEDFLGHPVEKAVVTVPAYFNDSQRQATKDAGFIAGLEVVRIINEPTAASLAYGLNTNEHERIAVFDLGGGTFDITILESRSGIFDVLATNGDTHLGGDDFNQVLVEFVGEEFSKQHGFDPLGDREALARIREAAEKAKIELSSRTQTEINLPFLAMDASGPKHFAATVSRVQFERLTDPLIERCRLPCENALADAGLSVDDIDEVVLVGGSTRIPRVRELVAEVFGKEPNRAVNPDTAVAVGAAIQAGVIEGTVDNVLLLDVTPLSLGIEAQGGLTACFIERNTTVPTIKKEIFTTAKDGQTVVGIHIVQGEREFAKDNRSLGIFWLEDIRPARSGHPQIEVTFSIDANGILDVLACDLSSGNQQSIRVESSSGISRDDIDRMRAEAAQNAQADRLERDLLEARGAADKACLTAEKTAERAMGESKGKIERALTKVREATTGDDPARIEAAIWELNQAVGK